jgi:3-oxoacyl-[acyl-carrier protein] reductase
LRVALITGATGGLGRILAEGLDRAGYRIVINYLKSTGNAIELKAILENDPYLLQGDISDFKIVGRMAEKVEREIGELHLLINNAGITKDLPIMKYPESEWDRVLNTNLKGTFNCIRHFTPLMVRSGGGHIINISSYSGLRGREGQSAYSASKAALIGLTLSAARELSGYNIMVNALIPGYMPLGMGKVRSRAIERALEASISKSLSVPSNVVDFIKYITNTEGITGQIFSLESRI